MTKQHVLLSWDELICNSVSLVLPKASGATRAAETTFIFLNATSLAALLVRKYAPRVKLHTRGCVHRGGVRLYTGFNTLNNVKLILFSLLR